MEYLLFLAVVWGIFGFLGMWIASQKGRSEAEGFLLGLLFGPLGALIEAVLPNVTPQQRSAAPTPGPAAAAANRLTQDQLESIKAAREARRKVEEEERVRAAEEARRRNRELREKVGAALVWLLDSPYRCYVALPGWAQPIVWGLAIAVLVLAVVVTWAALGRVPD